MITYQAIGYYACLALVPAVILLTLLPRDSRARRLLSRAVIAAFLLITTIVGLSY
ncbi:hypothetical protein ACFWNG_03925 [Streptomyces sp. NPDC058391]|uniref:hypothetical protein n=1 Tax=Streptomyces sp. NPDC058391 TaxID=3346476 RepID=UPI003647B104